MKHLVYQVPSSGRNNKTSLSGAERSGRLNRRERRKNERGKYERGKYERGKYERGKYERGKCERFGTSMTRRCCNAEEVVAALDGPIVTFAQWEQNGTCIFKSMLFFSSNYLYTFIPYRSISR
jgi:hypothetical protein